MANRWSGRRKRRSGNAISQRQGADRGGLPRPRKVPGGEALSRERPARGPRGIDEDPQQRTYRAPGLQLIELRRSYGDLHAVRGVSLTIEEGEFFAVIGPSGCGKSTMLRLIAGLEAPSAGSVGVAGRDVTKLPAYKRPVNTVFQQYGLFPHLVVADNVGFGLREQRLPRADIRARVKEMLELVGLGGFERSQPNQLSGGEQQRVALARSLVMRPRVLLLDEPLGALDLKLRRSMQLLIKDLHRELRTTFVYVTHDQEEAFAMADRVAVMNAGLVQQVGKPVEVYRQPSTRFVGEFVGLSNLVLVNVKTTVPEGYMVECDGVEGEFKVPGTSGQSPGSEAVLIIRPEALWLSQEAEGTLTIKGTVTDVAPLGAVTMYRVGTGCFGELRVSMPGREAGRGCAEEDRVYVNCVPSETWLVGE